LLCESQCSFLQIIPSCLASHLCIPIST
jgi:hypothetical protein